MARPKKALLFYYAPHGSEARYFIERLIPSLIDAGYEVQSVCVLAPGPELNKEHHRVSMLWIPGKLRGGFLFWLWFVLVSPFNLLSFAFGGRYRVIVVAHPAFAFLAKLASLISFTPIVLFLEKAPWRTWRRRNRGLPARAVARIVDELGVHFAKRVVPSSKALASELALELALPSRKIFPLAFATERKWTKEGSRQRSAEFLARKKELSQKYELSRRSFFVVTAGDMDDHHDLEYVIRAISAAEPAELCLFLPGDGPGRPALESIAMSLGVFHRVVFVGTAATIRDLVEGCDLVVIPGGYQGLPCWQVQLLGLGVPVAGARSPETEELLSYPECIFEPNDVESLAQLLRTLATNPKRLERLTELTAERAGHYRFDWSGEAADILGE